MVKSQSGSMLKFVVQTKPSSSRNTLVDENECDNANDVSKDAEKDVHMDNQSESIGVDENQNMEQFENEEPEAEGIQDQHEFVNIDDPGNWGVINNSRRDFLVEKGPPARPQIDYKFPKDSINRCFSHTSYTRKMRNGEKHDREWLIYSKSKDLIFCFCCKLFSQEDHLLASTGYSDWSNSRGLKSHEKGDNHILCMTKWAELEMRLRRKDTIDKRMQEEVNIEKRHWRDVLIRIPSLVETFATRNIAFRGDNEKIGDPNNGNFLGMIESISKFDFVMKEHLRRYEKGETH